MKPIILTTIILALTACTYVRTEGATIVDFHPAGDAVDVSLEKADGTKLKASRSQESSAEIVADSVDAAMGLL